MALATFDDVPAQRQILDAKGRIFDNFECLGTPASDVSTNPRTDDVKPTNMIEFSKKYHFAKLEEIPEY